MIDALFILTYAILYIFISRSVLNTKMILVNFFAKFAMKFIMLFFFLAGDIVIRDYINNVTITLLPAVYTYFFAIIWLAALTIDLIVFILDYNNK